MSEESKRPRGPRGGKRGPARRPSGTGKGPRRPEHERAGKGPRRTEPEGALKGPRRTEHERGPDGRPKGRRPLVAQGGAIEIEGDADLGEVLAEAFRTADGAEPDTLTHGFHSYPARMHPAIAYHLVRELTREHGNVLDPFCGSGTVPLEAMVAGRPAVGVDLNPLAIRVAEVKCSLRDRKSREGFARLLRAIAARSEERVRARVDARAPLPPSEARWYRGHVLKELAGLREEILVVERDEDRRALEVVLSAIVVKFSHQQADTTQQSVEKRIRKGLPTEFFLRKGMELVDRWASVFDEAPRDARPPYLKEGDIRRLAWNVPRRYAADLILSSPPYGGTYDYVDHHARRYAWLGLDAGKLEKFEMGARRRLSGEDGEKRWDHEVGEMLGAMAGVLADGGMIVLLVGDAQPGGKRIDAAQQLARLAPAAGLEVTASASQPRPDWTGKAPRREHLVALTK